MISLFNAESLHRMKYQPKPPIGSSGNIFAFNSVNAKGNSELLPFRYPQARPQRPFMVTEVWSERQKRP